ncbi:restriction endonuclease subunit S [Isoalcanivorax beigongshangi]|uniref:Restriction endonuclease subunit S n=1 Tax=Isoalcanivorax beigongshangi TaxID=3238810 RepID=A0ABV4AHI0_9GAMM
MSELPNGWERAEIGDLCNLINGRAFKPQEWSDSGLPIIRIQNLNNPASKFNHFSGDFDAKHHVKNGDLLFAWSGTPGTSFGAHIWHGGDAVLNQHIFKIEFSERETNRGFLRYAINQKLDELISSAQGGVGLRHVTKGTFEKTEISFPPLAEQTRIAQKLDELLAQVDTLKARIDAIPALLKRFRQSVLAAAVSGRLTEEWREEKPGDLGVVLNPKAKALGMEELAAAEELLTEPLPTFWKKYALEQLVEPDRGIPYGIVQTGSAVEKGIPTVRCGDVKNLFIDTSGLKIVSAEIEHEYKRTRLKGGEVLLAIRGSVGNVGVVPVSLRDCNISRELAMIPTLPSVVPFYLACLLQSPLGQRLLVGKVRGVAQKGINLADVRRLPVALPPYEEQTEIVRRVEQLFAFADQLEAKVASAKSRIDHLTQSVLAKAFRGELVPQDPNDEPASVLLERIKTQRAAAPKARRGRKASA